MSEYSRIETTILIRYVALSRKLFGHGHTITSLEPGEHE